MPDIKTYNSAGGGANYSDLGTWFSYTYTNTPPSDRTYILQVAEGVHTPATNTIFNSSYSALNYVISGAVPLNPSTPGSGAVFQPDAPMSIFRVFDGDTLSSLTVENIEFDLTSGAVNYGALVTFDTTRSDVDRPYIYRNCRFRNLSGAESGNYALRHSPGKGSNYPNERVQHSVTVENVIVHDFDNSVGTPIFVTNTLGSDDVDSSSIFRGLVTGDSSIFINNDATWGRTEGTISKTRVFEGCIVRGLNSQRGGGPGDKYFSATDCIADSTTPFGHSDFTKLNTSEAITINLSGAPGAGEVSFVSGQVGDFRLYDDETNNLAIGFVTNSTPVSPDFAGNDRGNTPFDAGAVEFKIDSGGADVTAAFGNVYVRLY